MQHYCVNFEAQADRRRSTPVFKSEILTAKEHKTCDVHLDEDLGHAGVVAAIMDLNDLGGWPFTMVCVPRKNKKK